MRRQQAGCGRVGRYANAFSPADNARYWISNLVREGTEEGATGTCYLKILHVAQSGGRTMISLTGIYTDVMTKADGDWKFASRHIARDE